MYSKDKLHATELMTERVPGDPETQRWPAVDTDGRAAPDPDEVVWWAGRGSLWCEKQNDRGRWKTTFIASSASSISQVVDAVFTDRRMIWSLDERKEMKKTKRRDAIAVGQFRYEWARRVMWKENRFAPVSSSIYLEAAGSEPLRVHMTRAKGGSTNLATPELCERISTACGAAFTPRPGPRMHLVELNQDAFVPPIEL